MKEKTKHINIAHGRKGAYTELLKKIEEDGVCPFCVPYLKKYHTEPILKTTKYWTLTYNQNPYDGSKIHLLLIAKRHIIKLSDINKDESIDLINLIKWSEKKYKIPGGTFLMRFGDTDYTGSSVCHLHAHIISGGKRIKDKELKVRVAYKK
jgi:ATP adenylyltransferase